MPPPRSEIDFHAAAELLRGVVRRTPLEPFPLPEHPDVELRLKLECVQETGSFKCRGAWNQVSRLTPAERERGVVATSSGNHGRALAWAAARAGVPATILMPADAYPNKVQACRDAGAEVVLLPTRQEAEEECARRAAAGAVWIHPYDAERTIQGAGTVGLEIFEDWPEVDVVVVPVGGGGLLAGSSLALQQASGGRVTVIAVEPAGAPTMTLALERGEPVVVEAITTAVQGLCPLSAGRLNTRICLETVAGTITLDDPAIHAAQKRLVDAGWTVEPAGAAASAAVFGGHLAAKLPARLAKSRSATDPLRVAAVVSGGNPDPAQLESLRSA